MTANASRLHLLSDIVKELFESERPDHEEIKNRQEFIMKRYNNLCSLGRSVFNAG